MHRQVHCALVLSLVTTVCAASPRPSYNPQSGACEVDGQTAPRQRIDTAMLLRSKDAECTDLNGVTLESVQDERGQGWNFRGADLSDAKLVFVTFTDSDFSGAMIGGANGNYAVLQGRRDAFTVPPSGFLWECESAAATFACSH